MDGGRWRKVRQLFFRGLEIPPEERRIFLQRCCKGDEALMNYVLSLLRAHDRSGSILDTPKTVKPDPSSTFAEGEVLLNRFRIERLLGQGGMGVVYEAQDLHRQERVALKTIRSNQPNLRNLLTRFRQEIRLACRVTHRNVCRVFDLHTAATKRGSLSFLTMELLQGETLAERIRRDGPLREPYAVHVAKQIAMGLQAAHEQGIIHRDLKSANVMLVPESKGKVRAVLTDFGLARHSNASPRRSHGSFALSGTPGYIAPELFNGSPPRVSSDLYALGIVLHELVTGQRPTDPTEPCPKTYIPELSDGWEKTIRRCLRANPSERFSSAAELMRHLTKTTRPTRMRTQNRPGEVTPAARQAYEFYDRGANYLERGTDSVDLAASLFQKALEVDPSFAPAHAALADAYMARYRSSGNISMLDHAEQNCHKALSLDGQLARGYLIQGRIYAARGEHRLALQSYRRAAAIDPKERDIYLHMGIALDKLGRVKSGRKKLEKAIRLRPGYWYGYANLGLSHYSQGEFRQAEPLFRKAAELAPDNFDLLKNLGALYVQLGEYEKAETALLQSIQIKPNGPAFNNLSALYFLQRRFEESIPYSEKAVELARHRAELWAGLGNAYRWSSSQQDKAGDAYKKALQLFEERLRLDPTDAELRSAYAVTLAITGHKEQALQHLRQAARQAPRHMRVLFYSVWAYEILRDRARALTAVRKVVKNESITNEFLRYPDLDVLRQDPAYQQMVHRRQSKKRGGSNARR